MIWWTSANKLNRLYAGRHDALPRDAQILRNPHRKVFSACQTEPCAQSGPITQTGRAFRSAASKVRGRHAVKRLAICGSRGWICPGTDGFTAHDRKIYDREVLRLKMSLDDAKRQGADEMPRGTSFSADERHASEFRVHKAFGKLRREKWIYGHLHGKDNLDAACRASKRRGVQPCFFRLPGCKTKGGIQGERKSNFDRNRQSGRRRDA